MENMDVTQLTDPADVAISIQTFKSDNYWSLQKSLEDIEPNYIVMYHSNITTIRQIEVTTFASTKFYDTLVQLVVI